MIFCAHYLKIEYTRLLSIRVVAAKCPSASSFATIVIVWGINFQFNVTCGARVAFKVCVSLFGNLSNNHFIRSFEIFNGKESLKISHHMCIVLSMEILRYQIGRLFKILNW